VVGLQYERGNRRKVAVSDSFIHTMQCIVKQKCLCNIFIYLFIYSYCCVVLTLCEI
jgi:hypothetical protein